MKNSSPMEIAIILHIRSRAGPFTDSGIATSDVLSRFLLNFEKLDLIQRVDLTETVCGWQVTPRGSVWCDMICDTPYPEQAWIDPRTKEIV